jgi:formylglycine-generating enzyme required for sulfatase activity
MLPRLGRALRVLLSCVLLRGQDPRAIRVRAETPTLAPEARVALVIGNSAYADASLRNPVNDARGVKAALEACKFEVTLLENASKRSMEDAIAAFGNRIRGGAVGLFYFAGHGLQVKGENFLIPIGARLDKEDEVPYEGVNVGRVLDKMDAAKNALNIVILDACRNNPFARSWNRGTGDKGLATVNAPSGSLIAYATAPGSTAADGTRENGLYTEALLKELREPGVKLLDVFQNVRKRVKDGSGGQQTPWESNSTVGDFFFQPLTTNLTGPSEAQLEATYWEGIQNSRDARELNTFLARFPNGSHAEMARLKMRALRSTSAPVVVSDLNEPWKALQKDKLETRDEYATRVEALGSVKVGTASLSVDNYNLDTRLLALTLQTEAWARHFVRPGRVVLELDRDQVRQLLAAGSTATVAIRFEVKNGSLQSGSLTIATTIGSYTPFAEPSPIIGAFRNSQGQWEVDLNLGTCPLRMVLVPPGSFRMGSEGKQEYKGGFANRNVPIHDVTIRQGFYLGKTEVTQAQWEDVMGANPSHFRGSDLPVEQVSWNDCQDFLQKLNARQTQWTFRLPTEAEWEYACRAGSTGDTDGALETAAWVDINSDHTTHPVGLLRANAFGLQDMLGNVEEWCLDTWQDDYAGAPTNGSAWIDPRSPQRVIRGRSYAHMAWGVSLASRRGNAPNQGDRTSGLRLVAIVKDP